MLTRYFPEEQLVLGGGTVLQARWNHRVSTDIDLFIERKLFEEVIGSFSNVLEQSLYSIRDVDNSRSWVDLNTVYCEVAGTEITVMPSSGYVNEPTGSVVSNTRVKTETTATILHKKLAARMVSAGSCEIRDVFDLFTAIRRDRASLDDAVRPIPQRDLDRISATMKSTPISWFDDTTKPLIGVDPQPNIASMVNALSSVFKFNHDKGHDLTL